MQLHNKILSISARAGRAATGIFRAGFSHLNLLRNLKIGHKSKPENPELLTNVGRKRGLSGRKTAIVGRAKASIHTGFQNFSRHSRHSRHKMKGVGFEQEKS